MEKEGKPNEKERTARGWGQAGTQQGLSVPPARLPRGGGGRGIMCGCSGNDRGCEPCTGKLCAVLRADVPTPHTVEPRDPELMLGSAGNEDAVLGLHVCTGDC